MTPVPDGTRRTAGFIAALAAVTVWAAWIPVTRFGVVTHMSPEDLAALRFGVSGLLLLPVLALRWREIPWRRIAVLVPLAAGAGAPYQLLFGHGVAIANSGQAAVLGPGLVSSFVAVLALVCLGEPLRRGQILGLLITLFGVAVVLGNDLSNGGTRMAGYLMIVAAGFLWAVYTTASRALRLHPFVNGALVAVVNALVYLPIYLAGNGAARLAAIPSGDLVAQALYQGVVTAIFALVAFAFAVERLGAATAASVTPLSPVLATTFGWLILGDRVDGATAIGLAAVATGVVVVNRRAALAAISR
jgi:drug/metabolite transporter (DMT)-like permease